MSRRRVLIQKAIGLILMLGAFCGVIAFAHGVGKSYMGEARPVTILIDGNPSKRKR